MALLTPDDVGGSNEDSVQHTRARQNVIFELGYFIGLLSRERACAPVTPGVEIPSDYSGVVYIELDAHGAWRAQVAREFKAAGILVDIQALL